MSNCCFLYRICWESQQGPSQQRCAGFKESEGLRWPMDFAGFIQRACQPLNLSNSSYNFWCQLKQMKICISHEWKSVSWKKKYFQSVIAEIFSSAWYKQTKIASSLVPCPRKSIPLTQVTCSDHIVFPMYTARITWRKTKPVTTTIILIRPLY